MSKALSCEVILTSASTRSDGSLGLRLATPELQPAEKTAFFEVLNKPMKAIFQPVDGPPDELVTVKAEMDVKTHSQRLRSVLFIWYKQQPDPKPSFDQFYAERMEAIIEHIKTKLEPQQ